MEIAPILPAWIHEIIREQYVQPRWMVAVHEVMAMHCTNSQLGQWLGAMPCSASALNLTKWGWHVQMSVQISEAQPTSSTAAGTDPQLPISAVQGHADQHAKVLSLLPSGVSDVL